MLNELVIGVLGLIAVVLAIIAYEISQIKATVTISEVKPPRKKTEKKTEKKVEKKVEEKVEKKVEKKTKKKPRKRSKSVDKPQKTVLYGEKWMKIVGENVMPIYEVSNFGRVIDIERGRLLKQSIYRDNVVANLKNKNGRSVARAVKVLVAKAFIGTQNIYKYNVIHIDGDPMNNNASNLKWEKKA